MLPCEQLPQIRVQHLLRRGEKYGSEHGISITTREFLIHRCAGPPFRVRIRQPEVLRASLSAVEEHALAYEDPDANMVTDCG